jgi:hypothetical protein
VSGLLSRIDATLSHVEKVLVSDSQPEKRRPPSGSSSHSTLTLEDLKRHVLDMKRDIGSLASPSQDAETPESIPNKGNSTKTAYDVSPYSNVTPQNGTFVTDVSPGTARFLGHRSSVDQHTDYSRRKDQDANDNDMPATNSVNVNANMDIVLAPPRKTKLSSKAPLSLSVKPVPYTHKSPTIAALKDQCKTKGNSEPDEVSDEDLLCSLQSRDDILSSRSTPVIFDVLSAKKEDIPSMTGDADNELTQYGRRDRTASKWQIHGKESNCMSSGSLSHQATQQRNAEVQNQEIQPPPISFSRSDNPDEKTERVSVLASEPHVSRTVQRSNVGEPIVINLGNTKKQASAAVSQEKVHQQDDAKKVHYQDSAAAGLHIGEPQNTAKQHRSPPQRNIPLQVLPQPHQYVRPMMMASPNCFQQIPLPGPSGIMHQQPSGLVHQMQFADASRQVLAPRSDGPFVFNAHHNLQPNEFLHARSHVKDRIPVNTTCLAPRLLPKDEHSNKENQQNVQQPRQWAKDEHSNKENLQSVEQQRWVEF